MFLLGFLPAGGPKGALSKLKIQGVGSRYKKETMLLIGIVGPKQSGKDTCADYLVRKYDFRKYAFAEPVKDVCEVMFKLEKDQLHDAWLKEQVDDRWGMTPRQMMQRVGTDMVRSVMGKDFWLRHMDARVHQEKWDRVVISDVRFANEADWVRRNHGVLLRIDDGSRSMDTHLSETEQQQINTDECIFNTKTSMFFDEVDRFVHTHFM